MDMSMNTKVITGGIIVIVIIIGIIYFMSRSSTPATPGTASTTPDQAAQTTTNASSTGQVQGQDVAVGTGAEATPGSVVSVLYVGKLQDGTVFDSSAAHGNQPLEFTLGTNGLIPGFQIGVNGMKVGGERLLVVPPTLGYGDQEIKDQAGKVVIPSNSTLVFDVKLVDVEPGSSTPATAQ
jgi:FKBP-type peptidyl-prolyl cis-trans isomerase